MRVILSGGGSGGHIYPALAVAQALRQEAGEAPPELRYLGARGLLDENIVARSGLPFTGVRAGPLRVSSPLRALRSIVDLLIGTVQAWRLIGRFRPDAVFATGGYASVPVGIAARLRRRPLLVYLPDVRPGWAVRLLARLATRIATTTEHAAGDIAADATVVGYPVREAFWSADRDEARERFDLPAEAKVLLVSGASQGARRLNAAVAEQLDELLGFGHVLHLTGRVDEAEMLERRDTLSDAKRERYHVFGFLEDMAGAMVAADLAVLRSGASVLGELPAAGLAAVLVPGVYEGWDQRPNARYMEERGASIVLENDQLEKLTDVVRELFSDDTRRRAMGAAALRMAQPDAAQRIAQLLREVASLNSAQGVAT